MDISDADKQGEEAGGKVCVSVRFKLRGNLRFLSHAETMRVFQRACARAGIRTVYSKGFNPHPRMSLVLPRSVGVESDDELLCLWLEEGFKSFDIESLKKEAPAGIEIVSVKISRERSIPEPTAVSYLIRVKDKDIERRIKGLIEELAAKDKIMVERRIGDRPETKVVDVRPFVNSIKQEGGDIFVDCAVSPSGTVRVDEILGLLRLGVEDLSKPVLRKCVQWQHN